jgi:hypothetical protein
MSSKINNGYDAEGRLKPKKISYDENPADINVKKLHDRDKGKVPLQVTRSLIILVRPERANPEYAEEYRQRMAAHASNW